ncbi:MAG: hypothetical protein HOQ05_04925 [Corynebacteriales bacterium]|nr:hypothetical protein [Mycobacteriales bacterium]
MLARRQVEAQGAPVSSDAWALVTNEHLYELARETEKVTGLPAPQELRIIDRLNAVNEIAYSILANSGKHNVDIDELATRYKQDLQRELARNAPTTKYWRSDRTRVENTAHVIVDQAAQAGVGLSASVFAFIPENIHTKAKQAVALGISYEDARDWHAARALLAHNAALAIGEVAGEEQTLSAHHAFVLATLDVYTDQVVDPKSAPLSSLLAPGGGQTKRRALARTAFNDPTVGPDRLREAIRDVGLAPTRQELDMYSHWHGRITR